ncbi:unnamed protein product, partial [Rotaria magnacalcarata]
QQYATALACPMTSSTNAGTTLLATANTTQTPMSLSTLQQHRSHGTTTSPYIFLSTSATASDEICGNIGNGTDITSGLMTGK